MWEDESVFLHIWEEDTVICYYISRKKQPTEIEGLSKKNLQKHKAEHNFFEFTIMGYNELVSHIAL